MLEAIANKQSSTIINEVSQKKLYTVIVYYGVQFVHIPISSYTANTRKIYHNVDLKELNVQELKMPTPGMRNLKSHVTSSTPPTSTAPMPIPQNKKQAFTQQSTSHMPITKNDSGSVSKNVKKFIAPRKIKK